jgi:hypothetical protein
MKSLKRITLIGAVALGALGVVMAVTNPSQPAYEEYAAQRLTELLKDEVCTKAPKVFGGNFLQSNCNELLDSSHFGMQKLIAANTQRKNFIFFSIYTTDLSVSPIIPAYHFETVGTLQNFYIYVAQER